MRVPMCGLTLHCPNSFFHRCLGYKPRVSFRRLPTHSRGAHRKFFRGSLLKLKLKFWLNIPYLARWAVLWLRGEYLIAIQGVALFLVVQ